MSSCLHDRALSFVCGWQDELCLQTMICRSVHSVTESDVFNEVAPESQKTLSLQSVLPLSHKREKLKQQMNIEFAYICIKISKLNSVVSFLFTFISS